uniref:Uncharacterized protein n=1 Tax=Rhizophora mucronata TaxID=61149 RepID=A0A2P2QMP0_RHIMU
MIYLLHVNAIMEQEMSAVAMDSNPYSRLMALQCMVIVTNYERMWEFPVVIVVCIHLLFVCFFYY